MNNDMGHAFSLREAAEACQVSTSTLKRRLRTGLFPNAERGTDGAWLVPLADLLAEGFTPQQEAVDGAAPGHTTVNTEPVAQTVTVPLDEYVNLRAAAALLDEIRAERDTLRIVLTRQIGSAESGHGSAATGPTAWISGLLNRS